MEWKLGNDYPYRSIENRRYLPYPEENKYLTVWQPTTDETISGDVIEGALLYEVKEEDPDFDPQFDLPLFTIPTSTIYRILDWMEDLKNTPSPELELDRQIRAFLNENPEIVKWAATAGYVILVATLIEDIVTLGAGIVDDHITFYIAYRLINVAKLL